MNTVIFPVPVPPELAKLEKSDWLLYKFELAKPIYNPIFLP